MITCRQPLMTCINMIFKKISCSLVCLLKLIIVYICIVFYLHLDLSIVYTCILQVEKFYRDIIFCMGMLLSLYVHSNILFNLQVEGSVFEPLPLWSDFSIKQIGKGPLPKTGQISQVVRDDLKNRL